MIAILVIAAGVIVIGMSWARWEDRKEARRAKKLD